MKTIRFILLSLLLCGSILIFNKCDKGRIEQYPLDSIFNKVKMSSMDSLKPLNICDYVNTDWDSILILKPYTNPSKESVLKKLNNFSSIKSQIEGIQYGDHSCYLLFVKNMSAVGFSVVNRGSIDFTTFPSVDDNGVAILNRQDCNRLFLNDDHLILTN